MFKRPCPHCGTAIHTRETVCPICTREVKPVNRVLLGRVALFVGVVIALGALIAINGSKTGSSTTTTATETSRIAKPDIPADQARFIVIVEEARRSYRTGSNDMAK